MNLRLGLLLVAFLGSVLATEEEARYDNYRVHKIVPETIDQLNILRDLSDSRIFSFWKDAYRVGDKALILVAPHQRPIFNDFVKLHNFKHTITIEDFQKRIEEQRSEMEGRRVAKGIDWKNYYRLADIYDWLDQLAASNPTVKVVNAGKSYENRDIRGIEITNGANLPGVIIESGIHAREWIGPASTSWVINEIINSASNSLWKQFNYLYFPVSNPDGYEYTHTTDRAWRKTRTPYRYLGIINCYGADPNRNWDYKWMSGGSSNVPCDETYAGPQAFSEVEMKALSDYFRSVSKRYDIYIDFHSFSQLLMYPWGYTGQDTPMEATWKRIGTAAANALKAVHGTSFEVGSIYDVIYQASGSSLEWYYGEFNATLAFVFELRDTGDNGFTLPPNQIIPSGEELLPAIQTFLTEYQKLPKKVQA